MRNNAWIALAIVGIIIAFAFNSSNGGSAGMIDVLENGTTIVNNTSVLDFQSPMTVTDVAGDAEINWDSMEVNDTAWGDGTQNILTWEFNPTGATNPLFEVRNNLIELNNLATFEVNAALDANLADDSVWIGNSSGRSTVTAWPDCDLKSQATTYSTGSNAIGCQFVATTFAVPDIGDFDPWSMPGYECRTTAATMDSLQNDINYTLIVPPETHTFTAIGINVTSAGAGGTVARLGIYDADETADGFLPGALIVDAGTVSIDSTGVKSIAISETLERGKPYFLALVHDAAAVSMTNCNVASLGAIPLTGRGVTPATALNATVPVALNMGTGAFSNPAATTDSINTVQSGSAVRLME
jgi:hypothetical protein